MQPFQYDVPCSAEKTCSISEAASPLRHLDAAITWPFVTSRRHPASLYAHGNTTWQRSCSHSTAICNQEFKNRIELRTREAPFIAEHRGGTNRVQQDRSRIRRTHEVPFHRRPEPPYRKNTRFRAQTGSQSEAHATSMQPLQCVLQHHLAIPHLSRRMATQHGNIHAAMPLRSATRNSRTE